jgi:hypothetical protein
VILLADTECSGIRNNGGKRYVREKEAAAFLDVSVYTLQSWRSRGNPAGPPVTKVGGMVMYSVKEPGLGLVVGYRTRSPCPNR